MQKNIGFVGLGIMGTPMVRKLAEKYPGVKVFDVEPARVQGLLSGPKPAAIKPSENVRGYRQKLRHRLSFPAEFIHCETGRSRREKDSPPL